MSPSQCDIVVIGAGPVGLLLSTCLARWGYNVKNIESRAEPTPTGRADGIQPRSLDLLRNMGLKSAIMAHKPARVYEVAFWDPGKQGIHRTGTWASCPSFIEARYPFTTLLHQGLIERVFIADLEKHNTAIQRSWTIHDFAHNNADPNYPVEVQLGRVDSSERETVRAKYLFSGEGARSMVREKLGIKIQHKDPIAHVWGVMDGVVRTNFPDIKMKCTIHSDAGSIMVIPREANMVRLYIQLASSTDSDWNPRKSATTAEVQAKAKAILKPYYIEWECVEWYSVYPIGQGIAQRYTLDNRVLLGGDACHTHSPKAGQGMNTAFLDAQNLAWKIHHVEAGFAHRDILLSTYESERKHIAENLLDFDARYAKLFSQRQPSAGEVGSANVPANNDGTPKASNDASGNDEQENPFITTFKQSCEFTSGYGVAYPPNILNYSPSHPAAATSAHSQLFLTYPTQTPLRTGRILPASTTTRIHDANTAHLEQEVPLNGSFRIYVFAGRPRSPTIPNQELIDFAKNAMRSRSFLGAHLRRDIAGVNYHECLNPHSLFFSFVTVFWAKRGDVEVDSVVPPLLARYRGLVHADDFGGREGAAHGKVGLVGGDSKCGEEEKEGKAKAAVVVVRPDGYVGCVVRLVEGTGTVDALDAYFGGFVRGVGPEKRDDGKFGESRVLAQL